MIDAWVISLADRPDRLAAFRARAAAADLEVQELIVPRCTERRDGWGASAEACGCAESHLQLLTADTGPLLVFEDDAMVPSLFNAYVSVALEHMPPTWELCLLGAGQITADYGSASLGVVPLHHFALTHAYLVSERGRDALAECAGRATGPWDGFASRRMCARGQTYGYTPTVVHQDPNLGSDIPESSSTNNEPKIPSFPSRGIPSTQWNVRFKR